jgi:protein-S-isoprenylcysteine O-methyltransferase Ste14
LPKRGGTFIQRWRVPLGFLCAAAFIFFAAPEVWSLVAGGAVALLGLLIRAWASGHIRKNAELAVSGPYAHTRNPLYLGSFLLGLGFTIAAVGNHIENVWLVLLFAAWFLGIYIPVMKIEAQDVNKLFPDAYASYSQNVPLFFPRFLPWRGGAEANKFDFNLYLKYREYRAALGLLAALFLLFVKATFF